MYRQSDLLTPVIFNMGSRSPWGRLPFFLGSRELLVKISIITSIFYMSYMEPLFGVPKIMGSPDKNDSLLAAFSFKIVFGCDYDHYSTVAFGIARMTL